MNDQALHKMKDIAYRTNLINKDIERIEDDLIKGKDVIKDVQSLRLDIAELNHELSELFVIEGCGGK